MNLEDLDISSSELKYIRGKVKGYKNDGYSTEEAIKKAIQFMVKESEAELVSIEKQIKENN